MADIMEVPEGLEVDELGRLCIYVYGWQYGQGNDGIEHFLPPEFWQEVNDYALNLAKTKYSNFLQGVHMSIKATLR